MIYYGCPKCQAAMASPDSLAGQSETCPACGQLTEVPSWREPTRPPEAAAIKAKHKRPKLLLIMLLVLTLMLVILGYFTAIKLGPESWRINGDGKAAFAALKDLDTSIGAPIGRDEYGQCMRRALLKVMPYLESKNAKSCPTFSRWIRDSMQWYTEAARCWNEPIPEYETTPRGEKLKFELRRANVQVKWAIAGTCLHNAKCVLENTPEKITPIREDETGAPEN